MKNLFWILLIFIGCGTSKYELEGSPKGNGKGRGAKNGEIKYSSSTSKTPRKKFSSQKIKKITFDKKLYVFKNITGIPSYLLNKKQSKILMGLSEFIEYWNIHSFASMDEYKVASFLSSIIKASEIDKNYIFEEISHLKEFTIPLLLLKKLSIDQKKELTFKQIKKTAIDYYNRGFNLNFLSKKDLLQFLHNFKDIVYDNRRRGLVSQNNLGMILKHLSESMKKEDFLLLKKVISNIQKKATIPDRTWTFSKFSLTTRQKDGVVLWLSVRFEEKTDKFVRNLLISSLKKPLFSSYEIALSDKKYYDSYIIGAAGSCPLCIPKWKIPGDVSFPKNLRKRDWGNFGEKVLNEFASDKVSQKLSGCVLSLLDFKSQFLFHLINAKKIPGEGLSSHTISKQFTDGKILKALWIELYFQLFVLTEDTSKTVFKPGCELSPSQFIGFRYIMETTSKNHDTAFNHLIHTLYLRAIFTNFGAIEKRVIKSITDSNIIRKIKYKNFDFSLNGNIKFLYNRKLLIEKLTKAIEYLSGNHGNAINWLIEDTPKEKFLISEKSKKAIAVIYSEFIPDFRVFLPSKFNFRRGMILSTPAYDAVDHFLVK